MVATALARNVYLLPMFEQLFDRNDGFDAWRLAVVGASLALSLAYLAYAGKAASPARTALKTAVIGALAILPFSYLGTTGANPIFALVAALALSALGDFFLALKDQQRFFVVGLAAFLAAHLAYIAAFLPYAVMPQGWSLAAVIVALVAAGAFLVVLVPRLGNMLMPVVAYFIVIMTMVTAALAIPGALWLLGAGAVLFAVSDSLIAVRKFIDPFKGSHAAIWVTYVAAQFLLTFAFLALIIPR